MKLCCLSLDCFSPKPKSKQLKVLFCPLDSYGHVNASIGIGQQILAHGHRVIFALEQAWKGKVSKYPGLEEVLYTDRGRNTQLAANEHWTEYVKHIKHTFGKDPIVSLKEAPAEFEEIFLHNFFRVHEELVALIGEVQPNIIVVDTYVSIPAVILSGIPWVWVTSAQPLTCLPHKNLPPAKTGYPVDGNKKLWKEYNRLATILNKDVVARFNERLATEFNLPPPPTGTFCHPSPYLNMYAYPKEVDYLDIRPLPEKWLQFDHFVRIESFIDEFLIPPEFLNRKQGNLIFVSMGTIGCSDKHLMTRMIDILSMSSHRFIFSLGQLEDSLQELLAPNMWGAAFVPQTTVLQLVDLVITHGGNNSFVEALYYGKPMLVTPLFFDQLDNAQRITEVGLGYRLNPYTCEPNEMLNMIDKLLDDEEMIFRLDKISHRMQTCRSTERAALAIESILD